MSCPNTELPMLPVPVFPPLTNLPNQTAIPYAFSQTDASGNLIYPTNLVGKKCVVVGGSRGIGLWTAINLAASGAIVVATSRKPTSYPTFPVVPYDPFQAPIPPITGQLSLSSKPLDIRFQWSVDEWFDIIVNAAPFNGHIDYLFIVAANFYFSPIQYATPEDILEVIQTNTFGHLRCMHKAIEFMTANDAIFAWDSTAGYDCSNFNPVYNIGKRAHLALVDTWNTENIYLPLFGYPQRPRAVMIQPGGNQTTLIQDINGWGKARDLKAYSNMVAPVQQIYNAIVGETPSVSNPQTTGNAVTWVVANNPVNQLPGRVWVGSPAIINNGEFQLVNLDFEVPSTDATNYFAEFFGAFVVLPPPDTEPPYLHPPTVPQVHGDQSTGPGRCIDESKDKSCRRGICTKYSLDKNYFPLPITPVVGEVAECIDASLLVKGRTYLIIGGVQGVGKALAKSLAKAGANVLVTSRYPVQKQVSKCFKIIEHPLDVAFQASVDIFFDQLEQQVRHIDTVVYAEPVAFFGPVADSEADDWIQTWQYGLFGIHRVVKRVLPFLNLDSKILLLSSEFGGEIQGVPLQGATNQTRQAMWKYVQNWNVDRYGLAKDGYPTVPVMTVISTTVVKDDSALHYFKPRKVSSESPLVKGARDAYINLQKTCGADPKFIANQVLQVLLIPSADVGYRYIADRKDNCFDLTLRQLIASTYVNPINETIASEAGFFSSLMPI